MKIKQFNTQFAEYVPEELQDGILYISMEYATASHKCPCGCGKEVVTPFTPTDWKLIYDGESVSFSPSIGNWSYPCRSHYLIRNSRVIWANDMSPEAIESGRRRDRANKERHYTKDSAIVMSQNPPEGESHNVKSISKTNRFLTTIARFFGFK